MRTLEYVRTYIDDLLVITMGTYDYHLNKVEAVLDRLRLAKLRVNVKKSSFALYTIRYLGYILSREGIKPQPEKVPAILALREPQNVKDLRRLLKSPNYGIFGIRSNGHRKSVCPARTNVTGQVSKYGNNHDKYGRY